MVPASYRFPCRLPTQGLLCLALALPWCAGAQPVAPDKPLAVEPASSAAPRLPLPEQVTVIEDDNARIEETRRRGQVVRVQVQSKVGQVRSYEIIVKPGADPASQQRGAAGRSAWQVLSF